jgi:hypothetical protein
MKASKAMAGMALAVSLAAAPAHADLFKCVKDGKTSYQEQPCPQGGAETKMQVYKPSAWVGCYQSNGRGWESGTHTENFEIKQERDLLYLPAGMEGKEETRLIMRPASPADLDGFNNAVLGGEKSGAKATSGLAMYGASIGDRQRIVEADRGVRAGFYWIRGEGTDSLMAFFPFMFDKTKKIPCPAKK